MRTKSTKQILIEEVKKLLPPEYHSQVEALINFLGVSYLQTKGTISKSTTEVNTPKKLSEMLGVLAGENITTPNAVIHFGDGQQIGEVTIRDVVGRDVVNFNIYLPDIRQSTNDPQIPHNNFSIYKYNNINEIPSELIGFFLMYVALKIAKNYFRVETTGEKYRLHRKSNELFPQGLQLVMRHFRVAMLRPAPLFINPSNIKEVLAYCKEAFEWWHSETQHFVSSPGEEIDLSTTNKTIRDNLSKKIDYAVYLLENLEDEEISTGIAELEQNPLRYQLWGFSSNEDFEEWLRPTTKTLLASKSAFDREVLRQILMSGSISIADLTVQGIPRGVIVEVCNCLLREKLAIFDYEREVCTLSLFGKQFLQGIMSK